MTTYKEEPVTTCICADLGATGPGQRHTRCQAHVVSPSDPRIAVHVQDIGRGTGAAIAAADRKLRREHEAKDRQDAAASIDTCPTPEKVALSTLRRAAIQAISVYESCGVWHRPYQCRCGEFHLTSTMPDGRTAVAEVHMDALFSTDPRLRAEVLKADGWTA